MFVTKDLMNTVISKTDPVDSQPSPSASRTSEPPCRKFLRCWRVVKAREFLRTLNRIHFFRDCPRTSTNHLQNWSREKRIVWHKGDKPGVVALVPPKPTGNHQLIARRKADTVTTSSCRISSLYTIVSRKDNNIGHIFLHISRNTATMGSPEALLSL